MIIFSEFAQLAKDFGPLIALFAVMVLSMLSVMWFLVRKIVAQMEARDQIFVEILTEKLESLIRNSGKTHLDKDGAVYEFRLTLRDHIWKKLDFVGNILDRNHIKKRKNEIKKQIRTEFDKITRMGANHLSSFNTPAGDMGQILLDVNFEKFYAEVFEIVFREKNAGTTAYEVNREKIKDLRTLMEGYLNYLTVIIEDKGNR